MIHIETMPDRETLEAFLEGGYDGGPKVVFNLVTGAFEWVRERDGSVGTDTGQERAVSPEDDR